MENTVKERRVAVGMTQEQLAQACGVGRSTVSEIEDGKHIPGIDVALRMAAALTVPVEELFRLN